MKKVLILLLLPIFLFCSCADMGKNVNAPVTVEDTGRSTIAERTSKATTAAATLSSTGRIPLEKVNFSVVDPQNSRGLPNVKMEYSYGVATNETVHENSASAQKFFEQKGYKAISCDLRDEKNLYLTFDCGYENGYTAKILDTLKEKNVPAAFFCTLYQIRNEPYLTARMINEGHIVGNHSTNHPNFADIDRQTMVDEILECDNYLRRNFGYTSPYFRFPEGCYTENALELVGSMGYTSVFWSCAYSDWDVADVKGGDYAFEKVISRIHPGAIILLHSVSPDNAEALADIIDTAREMGYKFKSLDEFGK